MKNIKKKKSSDNFARIYYALYSSLGSKKKVDEINRRNLEKAKRGDGRLVVLLHGMFANYHRSVYSTIKLLEKNGVDVVSIGYDYREPLHVSAKGFGKIIEDLIRDVGVREFDIVGICSGGALARYYAEELGGKNKIDKFVSVHSPARVISPSEFGFKLNKFLGGGAQEYNPGLSKISDKHTLKNCLIIYSVDDEIIPPKYAKIKGARSKEFFGSHIMVSYSPKILKEVSNFLKGDRG